jgi:hypothetical protein
MATVFQVPVTISMESTIRSLEEPMVSGVAAISSKTETEIS